jgi:hypothetical protein
LFGWEVVLVVRGAGLFPPPQKAVLALFLFVPCSLVMLIEGLFLEKSFLLVVMNDLFLRAKNVWYRF